MRKCVCVCAVRACVRAIGGSHYNPKSPYHLPNKQNINITPSQPYHPAFNEVAARGHVRRERVLKVIKMWYQMSLICGSDVTWVRALLLVGGRDWLVDRQTYR